MTFLTLGIIKGGVGSFAIFLPIVSIEGKVFDNVFYTVKGLGKEEIESFMGGGEMAIHAVGYEPLGIVHMGGRSPGDHCRFDFVASGAEVWR